MCLSGLGLFAIATAVQIVVSAWSELVYLALGLGFIAGNTLYQVAHRIRYGYWFEPTNIPPEAPPTVEPPDNKRLPNGPH